MGGGKQSEAVILRTRKTRKKSRSAAKLAAEASSKSMLVVDTKGSQLRAQMLAEVKRGAVTVP